jgi:hypothetical protein
MKALVLIFVLMFAPVVMGDYLSEINKMAGRKITVQFKYLDKTIEGTLKEANDTGFTLFVGGGEKVFVFYDAIASIKENK